MNTITWLWTIALCVFMFGGRFSVPVTFAIALIAVAFRGTAYSVATAIIRRSGLVSSAELGSLAHRALASAHPTPCGAGLCAGVPRTFWSARLHGPPFARSVVGRRVLHASVGLCQHRGRGT